MGAISGSVVSSIMLHDFDGTETDGDSFSGIVPTQRVKLNFDHDKTEYNAAILAGTFTGNFDTNLVSFSAFILDTPPLIGVSLPPPSGVTLTTQIESNTSTNRIDSATLRVEEDWANLNLIKYVVAQWTFTYSDGTNTITDYIRKTVDLNFKAFESTNTNIEFVEILDDDGGVVGETICDSYTGKLYPKFVSNLAGEYTQGLVTYDTKGGIKEENNHVNTNIAQSDTPILSALSPVNPINNLDDFQFCVDLAELNPNQTSGYCFNTILIFEGAYSTTTCDCIDIELAQTVVTTNALQISFDMAFTLSGGITAGEVDNIEFSYNGTIIGTYQFNGTLTGTINVILSSVGGVFPTSDYTVTINRSNGCNYNKTFILSAETTTLNSSTCPLYCDICWTSPDTDGSNVFFTNAAGLFQLGTLADYSDATEAGQLIIDLSDWLITNGYTFNQVLVSVNSNNTQINDICITGTDLNLGLGEIGFIYEDFGLQAPVTTNCLTAETSTLCTIQWNGVLTVGNCFIELADGTNIGDVSGYTGAQVLTAANVIKSHAEGLGFTVGALSGGANGSGHIDFITINNTNIPENYYRLRWTSTSGLNPIYGVTSACVTT